MLDVLQYRNAMGLKPRDCATHGLPESILQLLCLRLHLQDEVLLLAEIRNERCRRQIELLIQKSFEEILQEQIQMMNSAQNPH